MYDMIIIRITSRLPLINYTRYTRIVCTVQYNIHCTNCTQKSINRNQYNIQYIPKHAESRARYLRDTSHVICLPHIRQNLTALIARLCEKLQSHPRGCFGGGYPKRLASKIIMKEVCRVPASLASWPLRIIHSSRRHRPK